MFPIAASTFLFFISIYFARPPSSHFCPAPALSLRLVCAFCFLAGFAGCSAIGCRQDGTACSAAHGLQTHKKKVKERQGAIELSCALIFSASFFLSHFLFDASRIRTPILPQRAGFLVCCDPVTRVSPHREGAKEGWHTALTPHFVRTGTGARDVNRLDAPLGEDEDSQKMCRKTEEVFGRLRAPYHSNPLTGGPLHRYVVEGRSRLQQRFQNLRLAHLLSHCACLRVRFPRGVSFCDPDREGMAI